MTMRQAFSIVVLTSVFMSLPALGRLPIVLPLFTPATRTAAQEAMTQLRAQGYWLVNLELRRVEVHAGRICFSFEHRYARRGGKDLVEPLTTCLSP